jgi:hypothetical protein
MLANHSAIHDLFDRSLKQFDTLMRRQAFIDQYRQGKNRIKMIF